MRILAKTLRVLKHGATPIPNSRRWNSRVQTGEQSLASSGSACSSLWSAAACVSASHVQSVCSKHMPCSTWDRLACYDLESTMISVLLVMRCNNSAAVSRKLSLLCWISFWRCLSTKIHVRAFVEDSISLFVDWLIFALICHWPVTSSASPQRIIAFRAKVRPFASRCRLTPRTESATSCRKNLFPGFCSLPDHAPSLQTPFDHMFSQIVSIFLISHLFPGIFYLRYHKWVCSLNFISRTWRKVLDVCICGFQGSS